MTEMIERVALAICEADCDTPCTICNGRERDVTRPEAPPKMSPCPYLPEARAAIEAMRDPTDGQCDKGENALIFAKNTVQNLQREIPSGSWGAAILCWQAMIDAVLTSTESEASLKQ